MSVFGNYSNYYDSLYKDKDYPAEVNFVDSLIKKYGTGDVKTILDMGCGTGGHAFLLTEKGYDVTGIDISENMLSIAKEKAEKTKADVDFFKADVRDFDLNKKFDAVISMFAVMGYQTTNEDFERALLSARKHLRPDGLFIFDVWFGPAVIMQKPTDRVKTIENGNKKIIRRAHPILDIINHIVEVNYNIQEITENQLITETNESHKIRFYFYQELFYFLKTNKFNIMLICPFGDIDRKVDSDCWNISVVAKWV